MHNKHINLFLFNKDIPRSNIKERKKGGKKRVNTCNSKSLYYAILQTHVIGNILAGNTYKAVLGNILVEITVFPGQCDQCKTHKIGISMQQ